MRCPVVKEKEFSTKKKSDVFIFTKKESPFLYDPSIRFAKKPFLKCSAMSAVLYPIEKVLPAVGHPRRPVPHRFLPPQFCP